MYPSDGSFDSPEEFANITIDTAGWGEGVHEICVYAWDSEPNYNLVGGCAEMVIDGTPPEINDVTVDGVTTVHVKPGSMVVVTASVDDSNTGGLIVGGGNYTIGPGNWPGIVMDPADGSFDSVQESINITIDTTGWSDGRHNICVYAWDEAGNVNSTAECVEIMVDGTPPAISEVLVEPDPQNLEEELNISAVVTDNERVVQVTLDYTDPEGTLCMDVVMELEPATGRYLHTGSFDIAGEYSFTITAIDESGNSASESGSFEIRERVQPDLLGQFWWIAVIVILVAVVVIAFVLRKRSVSVEMPEDATGEPEENGHPPV